MRPDLSWWNVGVWAAAWLGAFCILEALASAKAWTQTHLGFQVPWDTFSRFIWDLQARWDILALPILFILAVLTSHLVRRQAIEEGDRKTVRQELKAAKIRRAKKVIANA